MACLRPTSAREQVRLGTHGLKMDKPLEQVALEAGRQVEATGPWLREGRRGRGPGQDDWYPASCTQAAGENRTWEVRAGPCGGGESP